MTKPSAGTDDVKEHWKDRSGSEVRPCTSHPGQFQLTHRKPTVLRLRCAWDGSSSFSQPRVLFLSRRCHFLIRSGRGVAEDRSEEDAVDADMQLHLNWMEEHPIGTDTETGRQCRKMLGLLFG
jgi:hypothetical protein